MAEDFKSLISAELDLSKVEQQIRELNKKYNLNLKVDSNGKGAQSLSKLTRNIALAEKQSGSFGATLKNALGIGSAAAVTIRSIQTINRLAKDMVENANRINDSMTQLKIVTKENDEVYKQYGQDVAQTAMEIGASISDLIDLTTTYARLGYSLQESSQLAKYSSMLKNVGDIDVSKTQNAVTAIVKAYDLGANEIESIMDKLVKVGNGFPISVAQIAEGMNNASSSLAAGGNTFEQSVALLTSANTTMQDIAKSSTGLRTIAARIRNVKTELDDLGEVMTDAEYGNLVSALTGANVSLTDENGELRSTYDIIRDIAKVWDNLTSMQQAGLADALAGTRQQAVFYSLINQFDEAEGAMSAMQTSAGELQSSYDIWLESTTAHINQLKAAFEELSSDAVQSGAVNAVVDAATNVVKLLDGVVDVTNAFGGLQTMLIAVAAAWTLTHNGLVADFAFKTFSTIINGVKNGFGNLKNAIGDVTHALPNAVTAWRNYKDGIISANTAMQATMPLITAIAAAIGVAVVAYRKYQQHLEDVADKAKQTAKETKEGLEGLATLKGQLDDGTHSVDELTEAFRKQLTQMGYTNTQIDDLIGQYDNLSDAIDGATQKVKEKSLADAKAWEAAEKRAAQSEYGGLFGFNGVMNLGNKSKGAFGLPDRDLWYRYMPENLEQTVAEAIGAGRQVDSIEDIVGYYDQLLETMEKLNEEAAKESFRTNFVDSIYDSSYYKNIADQITYLEEHFGDYIESVKQVQEMEKEMSSGGSGIIPPDSVDKLTELREQYDELHKSVSGVSAILSEVDKRQSILEDASKEMRENGEISNDTLKTLIDLVGQEENWLDYLEMENGQIKLNTDLWKNRMTEKFDAEIETLESELTVIQSENDELINQIALLQTKNEIMRTASQKLSDPLGTGIKIPGSDIRNKRSMLSDNIDPRMLAQSPEEQALKQEYEDNVDLAKQIRETIELLKAARDTNTREVADIISGKTDKETEEKKKEFNWIEKLIDRLQTKIDKYSKSASSRFITLSNRSKAAKEQIKAVTEQIELQETAYEKYMQLADEVNLSDELKERIREGSLEISEYDEETADLIQKYMDLYEAALECKSAVDELHESLATIYEDEFNRIETEYDNRTAMLDYLTDMYNTGLSTMEAKGYINSAEFYSALTTAVEHNIELLKEELKGLESALQSALDSGEIEMYSEAWYSMTAAIQNVKKSIGSATQQLAEFAKEMREIDWQYFDFMQERISDITAESEFLIDLLDNNPLFDSNGNMTNEGMSVLGLHAIDYNVYMAQADKYAEEILKIEQELANDPYNTDLIERRQELLELQRQSILAAEDEKQALIDLVQNGIEVELDKMRELIDAYKNCLDSMKDLHDYEKKINDQTSELAAIDKQISSLAGDDSEENQATLQKLYSERAEALENLQETEFDRYISEQKKLLDNLYDQYETLLNQRLDDVDVLISELISTVNLNADTIGQTLQVTADSVGYTLSDSMQQIFSNVSSNYGQMQNVVAQYGQGFLSALTTTNGVLQQISQQVANMQTYSNSWANNWIGSVNNSYIPDYSGWTPGGGDYSGGGYNDWDTEIVDDGDTGGYGGGNVGYTPPAPKQITVGGRINAAGATIYRRSDRSDGGTTQYYGSDPIYTVLSQQTNKYGETMLLVRHHSLSSGNTGWFRMNDVRAYAKGGIVDTTGLAWLDGTPQKPESVLNPEMTKTFIEFNEGLQDLRKQRLRGGGYDILPISPPMMPLNAGVPGYDSMVKSRLGVTNYGAETNQDIDFNITIPIDHVENYEDLVTHMRDDPKFEKMMSDMILGRIYTNNPHLKYRTRWK